MKRSSPSPSLLTPTKRAKSAKTSLPVLPEVIKTLIGQYVGKVSTVHKFTPEDKHLPLCSIRSPVTGRNLQLLPKAVTHLEVSQSFRGVLHKSHLPPTLKSIDVRRKCRIDPSVFPAGIKSLTFFPSAGQLTVPGAIRGGVEHITLRNFTDIIQPGALPPGLKSLELDSQYNRPIVPGGLPDGLETLKLGMAFNQPIVPGTLPTGLKSLTCGPIMYYPLVAGSLPANLQRLHMSWSRRSIEPGILPSGLKHLHVGDSSRIAIKAGILPTGLETLEFGHNGAPFEVGALPPNLRELHLGNDYQAPIVAGSLPPQLETLGFGRFSHAIAPGALPPSLKTLHIQEKYNHVFGVGEVPAGLERLILGHDAGFPDKPMPKSVRVMTIQRPAKQARRSYCSPIGAWATDKPIYYEY
jgi:hypothetical protein